MPNDASSRNIVYRIYDAHVVHYISVLKMDRDREQEIQSFEREMQLIGTARKLHSIVNEKRKEEFIGTVIFIIKIIFCWLCSKWPYVGVILALLTAVCTVPIFACKTTPLQLGDRNFHRYYKFLRRETRELLMYMAIVLGGIFLFTIPRVKSI